MEASLPAALFAAAALSGRQDLDYCTRSRIIANIDPFDIHCLHTAREGLTLAISKAGVSPEAPVLIRDSSLRTAADQAEKWLNRGLWAGFTSDLCGCGTVRQGFPRVVYCFGKASILENPIAAVLNSRKPKRITPQDEWLTLTKALVEFATFRGFTLSSSYGTMPYSLICALSLGSDLLVTCLGPLPFMSSGEVEQRFVLEYGDLFQWDRTLFISPWPPGRLPALAERCLERDRLVAGWASLLLLADIRPRGNMESIVDACMRTGTKVCRASLEPDGAVAISDVKSPDATARASKVLSSKSLCRSAGTRGQVAGSFGARGPSAESSGAQLKKCTCGRHETRMKGSRQQPRRDDLVCPDTPLLVHYTRACPGPWPGQSVAQYCRSLVEDRKGAAHSAFDTLIHILEQGLIYGSNRLTRGPWRVVSFSECLPGELWSLMAWRTGLARWSFEPYGIGMSKQALVKAGARRVIYGDEELYKKLPDDSLHLFQIAGPDGKDWSKEREWRVLGDLSLGLIDPQEITIVVDNEEEASAVRKLFGYRCTIFGW